MVALEAIVSSTVLTTISLLPNVLSRHGELEKCKAPDEKTSVSQDLSRSQEAYQRNP